MNDGETSRYCSEQAFPLLISPQDGKERKVPSSPHVEIVGGMPISRHLSWNSPQRLADILHLAHDPQHIPAHYLVDVCFCVAPSAQSNCDLR